MQTQLRIAKLFAASLLFTHLLSAATPPGTATQPQQHPDARTSGLASWYGAAHEGLTMANGQPFDPSKFTAASYLLPLGAKIRVFNAANGKSVVVTITDRGPARRLNRILDLSQAAAERLGYTKRGLALVYYSQL
jgi:rare lipoprotein A